MSAGNNHRMVRQVFRYIQVQGNVGEGGLEPDPRRDVDVKDELLQRLFDFAVVQIVIVDKGRQQSIEIGERLGAGRFALQGIKKVDDLSQSGSKMLRGSTFHFSFNTSKTLHQQIF